MPLHHSSKTLVLGPRDNSLRYRIPLFLNLLVVLGVEQSKTKRVNVFARRSSEIEFRSPRIPRIGTVFSM